MNEELEKHDELPDLTGSSIHNDPYNEFGNMKFVLTNARSLMPKLHSLVDCFTEMSLTMALVTETWLHDGNFDAFKDVLINEHKLNVIYKNRPKKKDGTTVTGGEATIIYDPQKIHLKEYKLKKSNHEIVAAYGKLPNIKRKMLVVCAYIPPRARSSNYSAASKLIADAVQNVKKTSVNPLVVIEGDFNRRKLSELTDKFRDIDQHFTGPTCGNADLDKIATNIEDIQVNVQRPLSDENDTRHSDHSVILMSTLLNNEHRFRKKKVTYRKFTQEGQVKFGKVLVELDWIKAFEDPSALVSKTDEVLEEMMSACFEEKTRTSKALDPPWITNQVMKVLKKCARKYKKWNRSQEWKILKKETERLISQEKGKHYQRVLSKLKETGAHQIPYKAIKDLKGGERPPQWDIRDINPDLSDAETAETVAEFFNAISREFRPLTENDVPQSWNKNYPFLLPYEVSARLKFSKKPKSKIKGDIFPQLVAAFPDLLAIPLTKIYNLVLYTYHWPSQWKLETVTVIPKGQNAASYEECRNLSCTPLFSKVCESFLMDRINSNVEIDLHQYSGVRKCGAEHMLLQSWDNILRGLEDNRGSINLMSLDFSKAFNHMSHQACLQAFHKKERPTRF